MKLANLAELTRGLALASGLLLAACSDSSEEAAATAGDFSSNYAAGSGEGWIETGEEDRQDFDEDAARDAAEDEIASEDYLAVGSPYGCTDDCSGHDAGFRYRAENGFVGYGSDSDSFREGGQAFEDAVEERVDEMREQYESGEDPY